MAKTEEEKKIAHKIAQAKYKNKPEVKLKQAEAHKAWSKNNKEYYKEYFKDEEKLAKRRSKDKAYTDKSSKNEFYTVYKIQIGNDVYIGQTIKKLRVRKLEHKRACKNINTLVYQWLKNFEDFTIEEIVTVQSKEEALILEGFYINEYKKNNFNIKNINKID